MDFPEDPTLGELDSRGRLHPELALLFSRLLGGDWRARRLSEAGDAVVNRGRENLVRHTAAGGANDAA